MALALLGCVPGTLAASADFVADLPARVPPMAAMERGEYRARDARTGQDLWRHTWTLSRNSEDGLTVVRVAQEGQGRRDGPGPTTWTAELQMRLSGGHFWLHSRRDVRDTLGAVLEVETRELDSAATTGRITVADARSGRRSLRDIRVTRSAIDLEMLPLELRLLPAADDQRMRFDLVAEEGRVVSMEAKIVGRETVEVPAGTFDCHRIDLEATGALGVVTGLLLPKISMWHTVAAPHFWVKYRGPAGGVGSREILRELTRFEQRGE